MVGNSGTEYRPNLVVSTPARATHADASTMTISLSEDFFTFTPSACGLVRRLRPEEPAASDNGFAIYGTDAAFRELAVEAGRQRTPGSNSVRLSGQNTDSPTITYDSGQDTTLTFNLVVNAYGRQQIFPTTIEIAGCAPARVTITRPAAWQETAEISNIHNKGSEDRDVPDFSFSPSYCGFEKYSVVNAADATADFNALVQIASAVTTAVANPEKKIRFPNHVLGKKEVTLTVHAIGG